MSYFVYFVFKGRSLLMSENNKPSVEKEKASSNKQGKKPANNKNNNFPAGCLGCGCSTFLSIIIIGILITHFISYETEVEKKLTANSNEPSITKTINTIKEEENNEDVSQTKTTEENDMSDINSSTQTLDTSNQPNEPKQPKQTKSTVQQPSTNQPAQDYNFKSCAEARAAGFSNITKDSPAYSRKLDRDGDGIACDK
jgi:Excalibur calcium-binding domain